eukprot:13248296-Alexandrium_andersonii.AAC.1
MSASLVGSEMCIRDRDAGKSLWDAWVARCMQEADFTNAMNPAVRDRLFTCLLYTSDAADDM